MSAHPCLVVELDWKYGLTTATSIIIPERYTLISI